MAQREHRQRRWSGLTAAFGVTPSQTSATCTDQPCRKGNFVTVLWGTELLASWGGASSRALLGSPTVCEQLWLSWGRFGVKLLPVTHHNRVLAALPTEMQLDVSFIMEKKAVSVAVSMKEVTENRIDVDIFLCIHMCTWYLHISFNLGSLVSLTRPTLLQTSGVLNQTITVVFNLKLLYTYHIPLFWHNSKLKIRRQDGRRHLKCIASSASFSLQFFKSITLKVHRAANKLNGCLK